MGLIEDIRREAAHEEYEWVVDLLSNTGKVFEAMIAVEGNNGRPVRARPRYGTVLPQRLEWIIKRLRHDVPEDASFWIRNVTTGEQIPGELFCDRKA